MKQVFIIFVMFAGCAGAELSPNNSKSKIESICKPPAVYAGNHITGIPEGQFPHLFSYEVLPADYSWVEGIQTGASLEYIIIPGKYETRIELSPRPNWPCPKTEDSLIKCDKTNTFRFVYETRMHVIEPVRVEKCKIPFLQKDGKTRIVTQPTMVVGKILRY